MKIIENLKFAALAALAVALLVQTTITQAGNKGRPVAPSKALSRGSSQRIASCWAARAFIAA